MSKIQLTIHQQISINMIKIGSMSNSSILQIGTAGTIQGRTELSNLGQFKKVAPEITDTQTEIIDPLSNR